jgi:hypothetical protein
MYLRNQSITTKYYQIVQVWKNFNKDLPNCTSLKALQQRFTQLYKSESTSTKFYPIVQIWKHLYKDLPNCTSLKARQQRFTQLYKPETKWKSTCRHPREKICEIYPYIPSCLVKDQNMKDSTYAKLDITGVLLWCSFGWLEVVYFFPIYYTLNLACQKN